MTIDTLTRPAPVASTSASPDFAWALPVPEPVAPTGTGGPTNPVTNLKKILDKAQALRKIENKGGMYCGECEPPQYVGGTPTLVITNQKEYDRLMDLVDVFYAQASQGFFIDKFREFGFSTKIDPGGDVNIYYKSQDISGVDNCFDAYRNSLPGSFYVSELGVFYKIVGDGDGYQEVGTDENSLDYHLDKIVTIIDKSTYDKGIAEWEAAVVAIRDCTPVGQREKAEREQLARAEAERQQQIEQQIQQERERTAAAARQDELNRQAEANRQQAAAQRAAAAEAEAKRKAAEDAARKAAEKEPRPCKKCPID